MKESLTIWHLVDGFVGFLDGTLSKLHCLCVYYLKILDYVIFSYFLSPNCALFQIFNKARALPCAHTPTDLCVTHPNNFGHEGTSHSRHFWC